MYACAVPREQVAVVDGSWKVVLPLEEMGIEPDTDNDVPLCYEEAANGHLTRVIGYLQKSAFWGLTSIRPPI